eukprot:CAMPEP_0202878530 /NCGR_PEP_ID=MMETSP1391-20130828/32314_1 /ASSEMBLY_ACC=CAM_ASM_000867 /TAXON_ID=1034604 /ORGANISM="Chlamydomonas leiostraca, Strain SAG 11-49" /LENGTH=204 /DNA_ID=CAMNT_0049560727 /DNA_START=98 /DNA_END=709 /DNA_ORIENTATION=+
MALLWLVILVAFVAGLALGKLASQLPDDFTTSFAARARRAWVNLAHQMNVAAARALGRPVPAAPAHDTPMPMSCTAGGDGDAQHHLGTSEVTAAGPQQAAIPAAPAAPKRPWHVEEEDARALAARLAAQESGEEGGWKSMMTKEVQGMYKYSAFKRPLPGSKLTEYKTVTVTPGITPLELMEFLLDDAARQAWEGMLVKAEIVE